MSVSEATCIRFINKRKLKKFNKKLSLVVNKLFNEFADSSLDNDQFFAMESLFTEKIGKY